MTSLLKWPNESKIPSGKKICVFVIPQSPKGSLFCSHNHGHSFSSFLTSHISASPVTEENNIYCINTLQKNNFFNNSRNEFETLLR